MSLSFELKGIPNWESLCVEDDPQNPGKTRYTPMTQAIIFATVATGIGVITEKNYIEFYLREQAVNTMSQWPGRGFDITLEDVKNHIGLRTNVSPMTRSQWIKNHIEASIREIEYRIRRDAKAKEQESAS